MWGKAHGLVLLEEDICIWLTVVSNSGCVSKRQAEILCLIGIRYLSESEGRLQWRGPGELEEQWSLQCWLRSGFWKLFTYCSSASCQSPRRQQQACRILLPCANAVTVCNSLLCSNVSGFPEQYIPWLQHLAERSAALQGSEHWKGDQPSPFWLEILPVGWLLPLWLNNTGLLPLASLPFLFILHANSRISCPWLFYPDGKIICISYAQRNNKPFLHK